MKFKHPWKAIVPGDRYPQDFYPGGTVPEGLEDAALAAGVGYYTAAKEAEAKAAKEAEAKAAKEAEAKAAKEAEAKSGKPEDAKV